MIFFFRMESVEIPRSKLKKRKSETTKLIESLKRILGIQLESKGPGENVRHIHKKIIDKFHSLNTKIDQLENQIRNLIISKESTFDQQKTILELERRILTLKSSHDSREALICRQRRQISELKLDVEKLKHEKRNLLHEVWPEECLEGVNLEN